MRPELREWIDRLVAVAPPLSDRQITLLRQLMPPVLPEAKGPNPPPQPPKEPCRPDPRSPRPHPPRRELVPA